jgi:hypothetical protein
MLEQLLSRQVLASADDLGDASLPDASLVKRSKVFW